MNVLFLDVVHPILEQRLTDKGYRCIDGTQLSREDAMSQLKDIQGIVIRSRIKMDEAFLSSANDLKFIARSGAGMENIDENYCHKNSITLFNAPEGNRNAVAEHALGMLLALFNRVVIADREVRCGKWRREENRGVELEGKTVGIIGFGNNGSQFAKKLTGFDCDVIAYDKYKNGFSSDTAEEVSLDQIFERSDVVSFHIPQNEETIGMGGKAFFDKFKKPIYVINLARGKVIQTSALVEAMKNDQVVGACLDVLEYEKSSFESFFEQELPQDFQYLLKSDRVILSPHVGGWTHESYFKLSDVLADKILSHF
jgi:D-3-phosphoglycerate dehydrogenase